MPHNPLDPAEPPSVYDRDADVHTVTARRFAADTRIGAGVLSSLNVRQIPDPVMHDAVLRFEAALLAEELPPTTIDDVQQFEVPRFATWFDHFCATYRGRWWGWLIGLHRHTLRYVDDTWTHRATVAVATHWTYPRATLVAPGRQFGQVTLKASTRHHGMIRPW